MRARGSCWERQRSNLVAAMKSPVWSQNAQNIKFKIRRPESRPVNHEAQTRARLKDETVFLPVDATQRPPN